MKKFIVYGCMLLTMTSLVQAATVDNEDLRKNKFTQLINELGKVYKANRALLTVVQRIAAIENTPENRNKLDELAKQLKTAMRESLVENQFLENLSQAERSRTITSPDARALHEEYMKLKQELREHDYHRLWLDATRKVSQ